MNEREAWLALSLCDGVGEATVAKLLRAFGSAAAALAAPEADIEAVEGVSGRAARAIASGAWEKALPGEIRAAQRLGIMVLTPVDPDYPAPLGRLDAKPPVVYARGSVSLDWTKAVTVVGTRRPTAAGRKAAASLTGELAGAGAIVVSGGALGIDTAAHEAALDAGGLTACVLGTGVDVVYPSRNAPLFDRICGSGGALLSTFRISAGPQKGNFPMRNRFLAALGRLVVVVQAGAQSGAMITASFAERMGKPLRVLPGVLSPGCDALAAAGRAEETGAGQILAELGLASKSGDNGRRLPDLPEPEARLASILGKGPLSTDGLARACSMSAGKVSAALLSLEIKGVVRRLAGNLFSLV